MPGKGQTPSDVTRQRMSEAKLGVPKSDEHRASMAAAQVQRHAQRRQREQIEGSPFHRLHQGLQSIERRRAKALRKWEKREESLYEKDITNKELGRRLLTVGRFKQRIHENHDAERKERFERCHWTEERYREELQTRPTP